MFSTALPRFAFRMLVSLTFLILSFFAAGSLSAQTARPNIVLIFADDLGWQDAGFAGSDFVQTPHLDRLAREGMVFRHAYAAAGNCAPSRACLLSGQYTPRHHVYAVGSTDRGPREQMRMIPVPNSRTLPAGTVTLAEALGTAGYATGMFGKCHLTAAGGTKSEQTGFDIVKVSQHSLNSTDPEDPKGIFSITAAACEFIESSRDRPFFAYVSHYAVHTRLQARQKVLEEYRQKAPGSRHADPLFAACIAELDTGVGLLLEKLQELNLADNTLVVFTSDNGGVFWSQEPLRGKKGGYYEGGIRVPTVVRWPGVVPAGSVCDEPVLSVDLYPTFLAAAGAKPSAGHVLDGADLSPLFRGEPFPDRAIYWHFPGYLNGPVPRGRDRVFRTRPVSVIRRGDWKLHLYHEEWQLDGGRGSLASNNAVELYNIADDPGEHRDLAQSNPAERDELLTALLAWIAETPAPLPTEVNPDWKADAAGGRRRNR